MSGKKNAAKGESDKEFYELLESLDGECFYEIFKEHNIDEKSLKYMTAKHLDVIVPKSLFGPRIIFERNLKKWQGKEIPNEDKPHQERRSLDHLEKILKDFDERMRNFERRIDRNEDSPRTVNNTLNIMICPFPGMFGGPLGMGGGPPGMGGVGGMLLGSLMGGGPPGMGGGGGLPGMLLGSLMGNLKK